VTIPSPEVWRNTNVHHAANGRGRWAGFDWC